MTVTRTSSSSASSFSAAPTVSPGTVAVFAATTTAVTDRVVDGRVSGDSQARFLVFTDGKVEWGAGSTSRDTNLYRSAADTLKTDDSLQVGGQLAVTGDTALSGTLSVGGKRVVPHPQQATGRYIWTSSPGAVSTSAALANGTLRLVPWRVEQAVTVVRIGGEITTVGDSGSHLRLGIYADNGSCYPGDVVLDAGSIAGDSATVQEITVSQALGPGLYWIGGAVQDVTTTQPTVRVNGTWTPPIALTAGTTIPSAGHLMVGYSATGVTSTLPATFTSTITTVGSAPRLFVKV